MKKEKRKLSFKDIEVRSIEEEGKKIVEGIIPYNSKSLPIWGTTEIIAPTAFKKTLSDNAEVRALFNHDDSKVLGSTKSSTLTLENTETGLICRCELPNTSYAADLYEIINRGDVKTLSFGFVPLKWTDDDNGKLRTLNEVRLLEVSYGVTFPAYPETTSLTYLRGLEKMNIDIEKLNELLLKEELTNEDKLFIKEIITILEELIKEKEVVKDEPAPTTQKNENTSDEQRKLIQLQIECELNN